VPTTVQLRMPGELVELYEPLNEEMGLSEASLPEGLLHHFATKTDDGFVIFDVWESRELFERFLNDRVAPAMQKLSEGEPPDMAPSFGELQNEFHKR
jgi:hypothetical protein